MLTPPPRNFQPAGDVAWAKFSAYTPPFAQKKQRRSFAQAQGVRYERQVQLSLAAFSPFYVASPWIKYTRRGQGKFFWAQPDGLLVDPLFGVITVVEVKHSHTPDAWWGVRQLYIPLLSRIFPRHQWTFRAIEVVKWYDVATAFPEPHRIVRSILDAPVSGFGVVIFNP